MVDLSRVATSAVRRHQDSAGGTQTILLRPQELNVEPRIPLAMPPVAGRQFVPTVAVRDSASLALAPPAVAMRRISVKSSTALMLPHGPLHRFSAGHGPYWRRSSRRSALTGLLYGPDRAKIHGKPAEGAPLDHWPHWNLWSSNTPGSSSDMRGTVRTSSRFSQSHGFIPRLVSAM